VDISSWEAAAIVDKALIYAFTLLSAGGVIFTFVFHRDLTNDERRWQARSASALAAFAAIASVLRLPIIAGTLGGDFASTRDAALLLFAFESEGMAMGLRLAGFALVFALIAEFPGALTIALTGSLLAASSFAFTGHSTATTDLGVLPRMLVAAHLVGASYWIGAFYPLKTLTREPDLLRIALIIKRFGNIALVAVGTLIVAGGVLLWILLETPTALFTTGYGRLFAIKLLLVIGILSLASVNKLILTPAFLRGDISAPARLRTSINAELGFAALILLVTAVFTTVSGPPALE
jgi:putative copper export protein